jgi:hypothetical protein
MYKIPGSTKRNTSHYVNSNGNWTRIGGVLSKRMPDWNTSSNASRWVMFKSSKIHAEVKAERAAFEEERRIADTEAMLAYLPSSPSSIGSQRVSASTSPDDAPSSIPPLETLPELSSPRRRLHAHKPSSPSPLSPSHKLRTPRPASIGKKRVKTPLSRLVLEKAVRQKGKETATASELARLEESVLGEGGRRGNEARPRGRSGPSENSLSGRPTPLQSSTMGRSTLKSAVNLAASKAGQADGEAKDPRRSTLGRDLTKADGVGPRAAKAKVWR